MKGLCKLHVGKIDIVNGLEGLRMNMNRYEGLLRRVLMKGFSRMGL
jgi:hypothetical protein